MHFSNAVICHVSNSKLMCISFQTSLSGSSSVSPRLTDLVKLAQECCYHSNLAVAAHGIIVLTNIAISCPEKGWFQCVMGQVKDSSNTNYSSVPSPQIHPTNVCSCVPMLSAAVCFFPSSDIVQLEQDTVLGVESLLMLCSQDSSPSAQATLKVRQDMTEKID